MTRSTKPSDPVPSSAVQPPARSFDTSDEPAPAAPEAAPPTKAAEPAPAPIDPGVRDPRCAANRAHVQGCACTGEMRRSMKRA